MTIGKVESVSCDPPMSSAIEQAFARLRAAGDDSVALDFDMSWHPTMDVVDVIARELIASKDIQMLTLIHPSAAMSVIAAAIGARGGKATVTSKRSIYDEPEDDETDATESNTVFQMEAHESMDAFVRTSIRGARGRAVHRVALVFDKDSRPTIALADTLVEELLQSGIRELGLIHASASLDAIAASVRLRLPSVGVALGNERKA